MVVTRSHNRSARIQWGTSLKCDEGSGLGHSGIPVHVAWLLQVGRPHLGEQEADGIQDVALARPTIGQILYRIFFGLTSVFKKNVILILSSGF